MVRLLITALVLLPAPGLTRPVAGQTFASAGPRAAALAGAVTALPGLAAADGNPASWASLDGGTAGVFVSEAFGLAALRLGAVFAAQPTPAGTFAAAARTYGFDAYRESRLALGYARRLGFATRRHALVGVSVGWHRVSIPSYGGAGTLRLRVGALLPIVPGLHVGAVLTNPHAPRLAGGEGLDRSLAIGMAFASGARVHVVVDALKDVRYPLTLRAGIEMQPVPVFIMRAGATGAPHRLTLGVGLRPGRLRIDAAADRHEVLGWSPVVGLGMTW